MPLIPSTDEPTCSNKATKWQTVERPGKSRRTRTARKNRSNQYYLSSMSHRKLSCFYLALSKFLLIQSSRLPLTSNPGGNAYFLSEILRDHKVQWERKQFPNFFLSFIFHCGARRVDHDSNLFEPFPLSFAVYPSVIFPSRVERTRDRG